MNIVIEDVVFTWCKECSYYHYDYYISDEITDDMIVQEFHKNNAIVIHCHKMLCHKYINKHANFINKYEPKNNAKRVRYS